jgi:hypothetical protein
LLLGSELPVLGVAELAGGKAGIVAEVLFNGGNSVWVDEEATAGVTGPGLVEALVPSVPGILGRFFSSTGRRV